MKKQSILFLIIYLAIASCNSNDNLTNQVFTKSLVLRDSIRINLPEHVPHIKSENRPFFNSNGQKFSYLTSATSGRHVLSVYDLEEKSWKTIDLEEQGPDQVYSQGAFDFGPEGQIIYLPVSAPYIIEMDEDGKQTNKFRYNESKMVLYDSKVKSPNIHDDGKYIYFDISEYRSLTDERTFKEAKLIGVMNKETKEFSSIIGYPEEFHNNTWSGNDVIHSFNLVDGFIYMSFAKSHYVYKYDKQGRLINKAEVRAPKIKDSRGGAGENSYSNALDQLNNGYYDRMIFDSWKDVFYRIAVYYDVNFEVQSPDQIGQAFMKRKLVLMIFDRDLTVLGESEFSSVQTRITESYFWAKKDGLYFYESPVNPDESHYYFRRFELSDVIN